MSHKKNRVRRRRRQQTRLRLPNTREASAVDKQKTCRTAGGTHPFHRRYSPRDGIEWPGSRIRSAHHVVGVCCFHFWLAPAPRRLDCHLKVGAVVSSPLRGEALSVAKSGAVPIRTCERIERCSCDSTGRRPSACSAARDTKKQHVWETRPQRRRNQPHENSPTQKQPAAQERRSLLTDTTPINTSGYMTTKTVTLRTRLEAVPRGHLLQERQCGPQTALEWSPTHFLVRRRYRSAMLSKESKEAKPAQ